MSKTKKFRVSGYKNIQRSKTKAVLMRTYKCIIHLERMIRISDDFFPKMMRAYIGEYYD